jgi:hypothetical protein
MPIIQVDTLEEYQNMNKVYFYFLFFASYEKDGKSWCPDCVAIESFLDPFKTSTQTLVKVLVSRTEWQKPESYFRKELQITNLPTLIDSQREMVWIEGQISSDLCAELAIQK